MATYFQKISQDRFDAEAGFVVRESRSMRLFIGLAALLVAALMFGSSLPVAILIAVFGVSSIIASTKNSVVMVINKEGFFYYGHLVTDWAHFVSARFLDEAPQLSKSSLGISDQFYVAVRYRKPNDESCYERKIALTNTQDKAEEEILAAFRFYYHLFLENTGQL